MKKPMALILQGGGALGAFEYGVVTRLVARRSLQKHITLVLAPSSSCSHSVWPKNERARESPDRLAQLDQQTLLVRPQPHLTAGEADRVDISLRIGRDPRHACAHAEFA